MPSATLIPGGSELQKGEQINNIPFTNNKFKPYKLI